MPNKSFKIPQSGFTLIELMVAIAIVAILSTVGLVIFGSTQSKARDAARTQDIRAIAYALEANRPSGTVGYSALAGNQFSNGSIPKDPKSGASVANGGREYCLYYLANVPPVAPPANPTSVWSQGSCPAVTGTSTIVINGNTITWPNPAPTSWTVCAALESGTVSCASNKL